MSFRHRRLLADLEPGPRPYECDRQPEPDLIGLFIERAMYQGNDKLSCWSCKAPINRDPDRAPLSYNWQKFRAPSTAR